VKGSKRYRTQNTKHRAQTQNNKIFHRELNELNQKNLLRKLTCLESSHNSKISIKGLTFIDFASNDYLNLSGHPEIITTTINALKKYGFGSGASRLLSGTHHAHERLEKKIAHFKMTEAALVFNSGYAANTGIIPVIAGKDSLVLSDELNHASIIDGTRLSGADVMVYKHRDMECLEALLKRSSSSREIKRRIIVTDSVFSMDGDIAPLKDLMMISRKYNTLLMIDDAHGTGILGETGRGGLEHFGIRGDSIIQMGTFSKAFGCYGAFVAGKKDLINLLISRARSFMYSTSLPPAVAEAGVKALEIVGSRSARLRKRLWKNRDRLYHGLRELGFDTLGTETPIIPVLTGEINRTLKMAELLYKNRIFAPAIRPPTVPEGKCRIRFTVTAGHADEDIDMLLEVMNKAKSM
jgi:8-amino-7-oxononanoate synthase